MLNNLPQFSFKFSVYRIWAVFSLYSATFLQVQTFLKGFELLFARGKVFSGRIFISDGISYLKDSRKDDIEFSTDER